MLDSEKAVLKKLLHEVVDEALPGLEQAEISRLPAGYASVVSGLVGFLDPILRAKLDAKIDAL